MSKLNIYKAYWDSKHPVIPKLNTEEEIEKIIDDVVGIHFDGGICYPDAIKKAKKQVLALISQAQQQARDEVCDKAKKKVQLFLVQLNLQSKEKDIISKDLCRLLLREIWDILDSLKAQRSKKLNHTERQYSDTYYPDWDKYGRDKAQKKGKKCQ